MNEHRDLRLLAAAAVALATLALVVPIEWLSLLLLAPLAFLLTGYAVVAATLVRRQPPWPQTLALSIGLSLAVLALLSLPLNYLGGLTPGTWALGLVLVTLLATAVAVARRPPGGRRPEAPRLPRAPRATPLSLALGVGGLLAAAAAVVLAFTPLSASRAVGFTELWMRPFAGSAGAGMRVGVGSEEKQRTSYRLQVRFAGDRTPIVRRVVLEPGEASVLRLLAAPQPTVDQPRFVTATLFLSGAPQRPYRRVYGWVPARDG